MTLYRKMNEIDFEVEKEVWNRYELDDGSMIRIRAILIKLLTPLITDTAKPPSQRVEGRFQNISVVTKSLDKNMGPFSGPITPQEIASLLKTEVGYTTFSEDWNIYRLPDGSRLKVKLVLSSVKKVKDRYDEDGYPIYLVQSTNALVVVPKGS